MKLFTQLSRKKTLTIAGVFVIICVLLGATWYLNRSRADVSIDEAYTPAELLSIKQKAEKLKADLESKPASFDGYQYSPYMMKPDSATIAKAAEYLKQERLAYLDNFIRSIDNQGNPISISTTLRDEKEAFYLTRKEIINMAEAPPNSQRFSAFITRKNLTQRQQNFINLSKQIDESIVKFTDLETRYQTKNENYEKIKAEAQELTKSVIAKLQAIKGDKDNNQLYRDRLDVLIVNLTNTNNSLFAELPKDASDNPALDEIVDDLMQQIASRNVPVKDMMLKDAPVGSDTSSYLIDKAKAEDQASQNEAYNQARHNSIEAQMKLFPQNGQMTEIKGSDVLNIAQQRAIYENNPAAGINGLTLGNLSAQDNEAIFSDPYIADTVGYLNVLYSELNDSNLSLDRKVEINGQIEMSKAYLRSLMNNVIQISADGNIVTTDSNLVLRRLRDQNTFNNVLHSYFDLQFSAMGGKIIDPTGDNIDTSSSEFYREYHQWANGLDNSTIDKILSVWDYNVANFYKYVIKSPLPIRSLTDVINMKSGNYEDMGETAPYMSYYSDYPAEFSTYPTSMGDIVSRNISNQSTTPPITGTRPEDQSRFDLAVNVAGDPQSGPDYKEVFLEEGLYVYESQGASYLRSVLPLNEYNTGISINPSTGNVEYRTTIKEREYNGTYKPVGYISFDPVTGSLNAKVSTKYKDKNVTLYSDPRLGQVYIELANTSGEPLRKLGNNVKIMSLKVGSNGQIGGSFKYANQLFNYNPNTQAFEVIHELKNGATVIFDTKGNVTGQINIYKNEPKDLTSTDPNQPSSSKISTNSTLFFDGKGRVALGTSIGKGGNTLGSLVINQEGKVNGSVDVGKLFGGKNGSSVLFGFDQKGINSVNVPIGSIGGGTFGIGIAKDGGLSIGGFVPVYGIPVPIGIGQDAQGGFRVTFPGGNISLGGQDNRPMDAPAPEFDAVSNNYKMDTVYFRHSYKKGLKTYRPYEKAVIDEAEQKARGELIYKVYNELLKRNPSITELCHWYFYTGHELVKSDEHLTREKRMAATEFVLRRSITQGTGSAVPALAKFQNKDEYDWIMAGKDPKSAPTRAADILGANPFTGDTIDRAQNQPDAVTNIQDSTSMDQLYKAVKEGCKADPLWTDKSLCDKITVN